MKVPLLEAVHLYIKDILHKTEATDALVILVNRDTNECRVAVHSKTTDPSYVLGILKRVLLEAKAEHEKKSRLIIPKWKDVEDIGGL